ncbi:hypothetical protein D3C59_37140 [Streptomyces sp. SHP22-7]|nr:hypothetical protein D3C59_37140 [Streptomyces sp. SHP22-7]
MGWLDHDEHGSLTVPASWSEQRSVRDLVLEPDADLDDDFVDQVAVAKFVKGFSVAELTDAEFLEAVKQCVAAGLALADIDQLRRWPRKTTENRVNRLRKQWQRSGRVFPELKQPGFRTFSRRRLWRSGRRRRPGRRTWSWRCRTARTGRRSGRS